MRHYLFGVLATWLWVLFRFGYVPRSWWRWAAILEWKHIR